MSTVAEDMLNWKVKTDYKKLDRNLNLYKYDKKYDKNFWDFKDLYSLLNKYVRKYESNYTFVHDIEND